MTCRRCEKEWDWQIYNICDKCLKEVTKTK